MDEFGIGPRDMAMIYLSPDPYHKAFEQTLALGKFNLITHPTGGMVLYLRDGRLHLASINLGSPAARIH
jgi:hypothetical protein